MFAALHLPDLTVMAAMRACPESRGKPCAVLEADVDPEAILEKVKLQLQAVNDLARETGIGPGWPLNRALVRCPDLKVLTPDPAGEAQLLREMIEQAESITPDLEVACKDTLLLDLSRTSSRHAARLGELEVADVWPLHARAATPDLARLAVRHEDCHERLVTSRDIARLPLGLLRFLPGGDEFLPLLKDWGLSKLGDFMQLPRQELTARLGPQSGEWHDLLHGKTCRLLRLHRPPESLEQTMDFEEPVTGTEPLVFAFKRLLHALSARLAARYVAVKTLRIVFHLERGGVFLREIRLPEPRVEEGELLRPIQVLLDSLKTGSSVAGLTLDVETTLPTAAQRDWFIRQLPQPERWTDTLAQLEALLGPGKVGIPVPPASHRPDDFKLRAAEGNASVASSGFFPANPLPLRRFRPGVSVMVFANVDPDQPRPLALLTGPYRGQVMESRGPFGTSGQWWDINPSWQRREWDVSLAGNHLLRLAFTPPDQWSIDGIYEKDARLGSPDAKENGATVISSGMRFKKRVRPFAEFHACSAFSFLRGASSPEQMILRARGLGLDAIAITDHEGFYGSPRAYKAAKELGGIRAITGATLEMDGAQVPVLCATQDGYKSLSRHLTNRHLKAIVSHGELNDGRLIALTGDREGPLIRHLLRDDKEAALRAARALIKTFGHGNVYVEIHRHSLRDDAKLNRYLVDLARHLRLPLLASNAPLYARREDRLLADAFTCLRHHTSLDAAGLLLEPNGERHLKSPQKMARLFHDLPEALENTARLSDRIGFALEDMGYQFPRLTDQDGKIFADQDQERLLWERCREGAIWRYGKCDEKIEKRLNKEISLICRLGVAGYFLIVQDIVLYARSERILCQGRGSAANSVVCFVLGITNVDAVKQKLVFERFLSDPPEGKKKEIVWPDIDIDFPSGDQREKAIQYVFNKYGARGAAMTANVITYRPRSAFREMSKVLGFPPSIADRFSTMGGSPEYQRWEERKEESGVPEKEKKRRDEERRHEAFEESTASLLPPSHPRLAALEKLYHAVLGLPRHLGQHSGGMVICAGGLDEVVPIQPASMPDRTIVQWDKDDCENLGLVKIDLLGLGMFAAMENMIEICKRRDEPVSLDEIPLDDPKVYDMLHRSDTIGTFQVESRAQMATLSILKPESFYEIAIQVAIVRPGPIVGDLLNPYLRRRNGREVPDCIHPKLEKALGRTLGVPLFQEQVLQMGMIIAGFDTTEIAELRRAMSFHRSHEQMERVTEKLHYRMTERGIPLNVQMKVIKATENFAEYGFPESHALSFAAVAYWSCWFKVHHPAAFYTGLINNQPMGFYSTHSLMQDGKRHGIRFLPVSCVHSLVVTDVVDEKVIRLGLHRLQGISKETQERIVGEKVREPFDSLEDFLSRVMPNARERRILAKSGALNDLPKAGHRRKAMWQVELPLYEDLLGGQEEASEEALDAMTMAERLAADLSIQGASTGPHAMKLWRRSHSEMGFVNARDLQSLPHGMPVRVGGLVICRQRPGTAKGHCFISLEDETGISNLFVKKEKFQRMRLTIVSEPFLMATGRVQIAEGGMRTIYVDEVFPLPGAEPVHAAESHDFH